MKVLLAEDDPFTREGLTEVLAGEGYDVVEASDGQSALLLKYVELPLPSPKFRD